MFGHSGFYVCLIQRWSFIWEAFRSKLSGMLAWVEVRLNGLQKSECMYCMYEIVWKIYMFYALGLCTTISSNKDNFEPLAQYFNISSLAALILQLPFLSLFFPTLFFDVHTEQNLARNELQWCPVWAHCRTSIGGFLSKEIAFCVPKTLVSFFQSCVYENVCTYCINDQRKGLYGQMCTICKCISSHVQDSSLK